MGRFVELAVLVACFVALASSADDVPKPVTEADFNTFIQDQMKCSKKTTQCEPNCPDGWVKYEGRCFRYFASIVDWATAELQCVSLGANLASIHNDGENLMVRALIRANDPAEKPTWLGLSNCQKPNSWIWTDGTRYDYGKWNANEPNRANGECCVHTNWPSKADWNDYPCSLTGASVCVKRLV